MARKPAPDVIEHDEDQTPIPDSVGDAANQMVQVSFDQEENAKALAVELHFDGPIHPTALEAGIRDSQQRISMELFNIGSRLLLLKEQCEHGEFMERLEGLTIAPRMAQRFMQATLKFSNASTSTHLQKLGKSKILELLVLDDDEVQELEFAGSVRGITIDDIDRMTISDLRKQLRDAKQQSEAKDKLLANKNTQLDELHTKLDDRKAALNTPDEELSRSLNELSLLSQQIAETLGTQYRKAMVDIADHHALHGGTSDDVMRGHLDKMDRELVELREAFSLINTAGWDSES